MSELNPVKTLNILEEVFGLRHCSPEGKPHPEIIELESYSYQEDYEELYSDSEKPLGCYIKYEYGEIAETLTKDEFLKLPRRPEKLYQLKNERRRCLELEREAGIIHGITDSLTMIEIPKLSFNFEDLKLE